MRSPKKGDRMTTTSNTSPAPIGGSVAVATGQPLDTLIPHIQSTQAWRHHHVALEPDVNGDTIRVAYEHSHVMNGEYYDLHVGRPHHFMKGAGCLEIGRDETPESFQNLPF